MEFIYSIWHSLPFIIRFPLEFGFYVIFLRGILASDIKSWLEDKGFIKKGKQSLIYHILDIGYNAGLWVGKLLIPERKRAFFSHYKEHGNESILACTNGSCAQI